MKIWVRHILASLFSAANIKYIILLYCCSIPAQYNLSLANLLL